MRLQIILLRVTRLFCGNLNKKVTEEELKQRLQGIVYIKWITDKQTGEFYGSSFLEMKDAPSAALAVQQDKSKFLGRCVTVLLRCMYMVTLHSLFTHISPYSGR